MKHFQIVTFDTLKTEAKALIAGIGYQATPQQTAAALMANPEAQHVAALIMHVGLLLPQHFTPSGAAAQISALRDIALTGVLIYVRPDYTADYVFHGLGSAPECIKELVAKGKHRDDSRLLAQAFYIASKFIAHGANCIGAYDRVADVAAQLLINTKAYKQCQLRMTSGK